MKILLLTDIPPCTNYTAGIVLNDLTKILIDEGHKVFCYCIKDISVKPEIDKNIEKKIKIKYIKKPKETWGSKPIISKIVSLFFNTLQLLFTLPNIKNDCKKYINDNKIDKIWATIQGKNMIYIINMITRKAKLPYSVHIWDPPEWWLNDNKIDFLTKKSVMNTFKNVVSRSNSCITSSYEMKKYYSNIYGAKCIPIYPSLNKNKLKIKKNNRDDKEFIIAFSGQAYAKNELESLFSAIDMMGWKYKNRNIVFRYYGYENIRFRTLKSCNINFRGWIQQDDLLTELSEVDLLYCPYFFSKEKSYEIVSRLSFPGKLTTYLSTKVPVLIHAPNYSSIYKFALKYDAAYLLDTIEAEKIINVIKNIIDDTRAHERNIVKNANNAFKDHLTFDSMKEKILEALELKQK